MLGGASGDEFNGGPPGFEEQFPKPGKAALELKFVPGGAVYSDCECECMYNVMKHKGMCPSCSSANKTVISGRDVKLISIA